MMADVMTVLCHNYYIITNDVFYENKTNFYSGCHVPGLFVE